MLYVITRWDQAPDWTHHFRMRCGVTTDRSVCVTLLIPMAATPHEELVETIRGVQCAAEAAGWVIHRLRLRPQWDQKVPLPSDANARNCRTERMASVALCYVGWFWDILYRLICENLLLCPFDLDLRWKLRASGLVSLPRSVAHALSRRLLLDGLTTSTVPPCAEWRTLVDSDAVTVTLTLRCSNGRDTVQ